jgi:hypothetical protein
VSVNSRIIAATPDHVWAVLADGWLYPTWVVGASRVREVDPAWPEIGSQIHHSVGVWPCLINDRTEVVDAMRGSRLVLAARGWPLGEAEVSLDLSPVGPDTEVVMTETVRSGPGRLVPPPAREPVLKWRNVETLRRLALVAEGRT